MNNLENNNKKLMIPIEMLAIAIGKNRNLHKYINEIYEKRQYEFEKGVFESKVAEEMYNSIFFSELNFEIELCSKKVFAILWYGTQHNIEKTNVDIIQILIKGWRYIYNYIKKRDEIYLSEVIMNYMDNNKRWTIDDLMDVLLVTYLISINFNKEVIRNNEGYKQLSKFIEYFDYRKVNAENNNVYFSTQCNWKKIDMIIDIVFRSIGKITDVESLLYETKVEKVERTFSRIDTLFMTEGLNITEIFGNRKIPKQLIRDIIDSYFINPKDEYSVEIGEIVIGDIDIEDITKFLINNLYLKLMMNEYKSVKKHYYDSEKRTIKGIGKELDKSKEKYELEIKIAEEEYEMLSKEYKKLHRENKALHKTLEEVDQNQEEVVELRQFIFNLDKEEEYVDQIIDNKIENVKAVVVGGTPKWQSKMKERFNEWDYLGVDNLNFDENIIKNTEVVIIYVNYLSHALYYKVINLVKKHDIKVKFIKYNQNIDIVHQDINNSIKMLFADNKIA